MSLELKDIYAVILCGGEGKRLKSVVSDRPKPMADIGGKPFLDLLVEMLEKQGLRNIVLCTCFMPGFIKGYYAKKKTASMISVSEETEPLGTAGALKLAGPKIGSDPFFVLNGDSYCEADLKGMLDFHKSRNADATILLSVCGNTGDYGSVKVDDKMKITGFQEKGPCTQDALVNAGVYLFSRKILDMIPDGRTYSAEYDLFPKLDNLYGFASDSGFMDIGTKDRYAKAGCLFKNEKDKK